MRGRKHQNCRAFRELLERALFEPSSKRIELSWHEHLSACPDCCRMLEEEDALDSLLASMPSPMLPEALAGRVLARLREQREGEALDALLELDQLREPEGLSGRIKEELALERLIGLDKGVDAPAGLNDRVLAAARAGSQAPVFTLRRFAPLAASLLALLGLFALSRDEASEPLTAGEAAAQAPSSEMLALLDLLGDETVWEDKLWEGDEVIDLALELDESDELLLEYLALAKEDEENG